jgi:hypothetical protein
MAFTSSDSMEVFSDTISVANSMKILVSLTQIIINIKEKLIKKLKVEVI